MTLTIRIDADAVTCLMPEHGGMACREAIDWIADGFEAELRKRGITGVVVKRDYRSTGHRSDNGEFPEVFDAVLCH